MISACAGPSAPARVRSTSWPPTWWHGFHREQQGLVHAQRADEHAHDPRGAGGRVDRFFYASSACVYNADKQKDPNITALKEIDAYPGLPEDGYGWEKLFSDACAATSARISVSRPASHVSTTFTGPTAHGKAGAKRSPPRSAARSSPPLSAVSTRSRSGATARRPARSCTSTIV